MEELDNQHSLEHHKQAEREDPVHKNAGISPVQRKHRVQRLRVDQSKYTQEALQDLRVQFHSSLSKLDSNDTREVALKDIQNTLKSLNFLESLRVFLSCLGENRGYKSAQARDSEVSLLSFIVEFFTERLVEKPPNPLRLLVKIGETVQTYFKDPSPMVRESASLTMCRIYKYSLPKDSNQIIFTYMFEPLSSILTSGVDTQAQQAAANTIFKWAKMVVHSKNQTLIKELFARTISVFLRQRADYIGLVSSIGLLIETCGISDEEVSAIIGKCIQYLRPGSSSPLKIETCKLLLLVSKHSPKVKCSNELIEVLVSMKNEAIIAVQTAAKDALLAWKPRTLDKTDSFTELSVEDRKMVRLSLEQLPQSKVMPAKIVTSFSNKIKAVKHMVRRSKDFTPEDSYWGQSKGSFLKKGSGNYAYIDVSKKKNRFKLARQGSRLKSVPEQELSQDKNKKLILSIDETDKQETHFSREAIEALYREHERTKDSFWRLRRRSNVIEEESKLKNREGYESYRPENSRSEDLIGRNFKEKNFETDEYETEHEKTEHLPLEDLKTNELKKEVLDGPKTEEFDKGNSAIGTLKIEYSEKEKKELEKPNPEEYKTEDFYPKSYKSDTFKPNFFRFEDFTTKDYAPRDLKIDFQTKTLQKNEYIKKQSLEIENFCSFCKKCEQDLKVTSHSTSIKPETISLRQEFFKIELITPQRTLKLKDLRLNKVQDKPIISFNIDRCQSLNITPQKENFPLFEKESVKSTHMSKTMINPRLDLVNINSLSLNSSHFRPKTPDKPYKKHKFRIRSELKMTSLKSFNLKAFSEKLQEFSDQIENNVELIYNKFKEIENRFQSIDVTLTIRNLRILKKRTSSIIGPKDILLSTWAEALKSLRNNNIEKAYIIVLDTEDDLYLVRLMHHTGICLSHLSVHLREELFKRLTNILYSKYMESLACAWLEEFFKQPDFSIAKEEKRKISDKLQGCSEAQALIAAMNAQ